MIDVQVARDALVLVGDGQKAMFLRNRGTPQKPRLVVENLFQQENAATRDQGTDKPGRQGSSTTPHRSAMEQTDWHQLAEDRFVAEVAEALYREAHAGRFDDLVVICPPKVLGNLRKAFHKSVTEKVSAEVPKELTSHPVEEIERLIAA